MSFDRRNFIKTLGVAGITLMAADTFGTIKKDNKGNVEFYGMLYDSTRCVGCQTCETVCAESHGLPAPVGVPKSGVIRKTDELHRTVVNSFKTSKGDVFIKTQCMHCNEPACGAACLTKAMYKTKEGPVIWRGEKCMGCRYCMVSCPFDIPKFEYHSSNPKIQKCTMCNEKIEKGGIPACAENCPAEAIKFGTRRELLAEARKRIVQNPGTYVDEIYGDQTAGGTGFMYISPVPFKELGFSTKLQNKSYPELSKGFLYSVPSVFVLLPPLLLGIYEATKKNNSKESDENE
ncbi:MAG: 4Fe-4S dicluster domain-containing protein [Bacteroidetes bacterium]|nr:4Fe-4S dicluster domain-containing protein [Bacteroidota bacterium]